MRLGKRRPQALHDLDRLTVVAVRIRVTTLRLPGNAPVHVGSRETVSQLDRPGLLRLGKRRTQALEQRHDLIPKHYFVIETMFVILRGGLLP